MENEKEVCVHEWIPAVISFAEDQPSVDACKKCGAICKRELSWSTHRDNRIKELEAKLKEAEAQIERMQANTNKYISDRLANSWEKVSEADTCRFIQGWIQDRDSISKDWTYMELATALVKFLGGGK